MWFGDQDLEHLMSNADSAAKSLYCIAEELELLNKNLGKLVEHLSEEVEGKHK